MKKSRLELLPIILKKYENKIEIDVEKGEIRGLSVWENHKGYLTINFWHNGKSKYYRVHEIIAYLGGLELEGLTVNHINENKKDNRLENLETLSSMDNHKAFNFRKTHEKLSPNEVENLIREYDGKRGNLTKLAHKFGVHPTTVTRYIKLYNME